MNSRKGMLDGLSAQGAAIVGLVFLLAIGATMVSQLNTTGNVSTTGQAIIATGESGLQSLANYIPLIVTVIVGTGLFVYFKYFR